MVLQKLWVSQNFSRISRVSQSRFLAVMCVSPSRFFIRCLGVSIFCKTKGISEKKSILTSPKCLNSTKSQKTYRSVIWRQKKSSYFVQEYFLPISMNVSTSTEIKHGRTLFAYFQTTGVVSDSASIKKNQRETTKRKLLAGNQVMARKIIVLTVDRFSVLMSRTMVYNKRLFCKTFACTTSSQLNFIALNQF